MKNLIMAAVLALSILAAPMVKAEEYVSVFGIVGATQSNISTVAHEPHFVDYKSTKGLNLDGGVAFSLGSKGTAAVLEVQRVNSAVVYLYGVSQKIATVKTLNFYLTGQLGYVHDIPKHSFVESGSVTVTKNLKGGFGVGPSFRYEKMGPFHGYSESLCLTKTFGFKGI